MISNPLLKKVEQKNTFKKWSKKTLLKSGAKKTLLKKVEMIIILYDGLYQIICFGGGF